MRHTAPVQIGPTQTANGAGITVASAVFAIVAGPSDAGATLTYGATGGTGGGYWFDVGVVAYSGFSSSGVPRLQQRDSVLQRGHPRECGQL